MNRDVSQVEQSPMDSPNGSDDLERTDELPILALAVDPDVGDDAVPMPPPRPAAARRERTPEELIERVSAQLEAQRAALDSLRQAGKAQAHGTETALAGLAGRLEAVERAQAILAGHDSSQRSAQEHLSQELATLRAMIERLDARLAEVVPAPAGAEPHDAPPVAAAEPGVPAAGPAADYVAELVRIDGDHPITHVLERRTRIGRAAGCELTIDSSSVSRHHAVLRLGSRDAIIEDLNSTNGVLVNGRRVSRQLLHHGDLVVIGEIQFRFVRRLAGTPGQAPG